jgi:hypothetical protein
LINGTCVADFKNTSCARNPAFCKWFDHMSIE